MPSSCPNQSVHSNGSHIYWVYCLMLLWFTQNFVSGPSSLRVCSACSYNASPPTSFSDASNADVHLHTNHLLFLASFCFSPPSFSISFALLATSPPSPLQVPFILGFVNQQLSFTQRTQVLHLGGIQLRKRRFQVCGFAAEQCRLLDTDVWSKFIDNVERGSLQFC